MPVLGSTSGELISLLSECNPDAGGKKEADIHASFPHFSLEYLEKQCLPLVRITVWVHTDTIIIYFKILHPSLSIRAS